MMVEELVVLVFGQNLLAIVSHGLVVIGAAACRESIHLVAGLRCCGEVLAIYWLHLVLLPLISSKI